MGRPRKSQAERNQIQRVDEWLRLALERERVGDDWKGTDKNGNPIKSRFQLLSSVFDDIPKASLYRMLGKPGNKVRFFLL